MIDFDEMDELEKAGDGARLKEQETTAGNETKAKLFKDMPVAYETRFKQLKAQGKVNGSFTAYCLDAIGIRLTNDGV